MCSKPKSKSSPAVGAAAAPGCTLMTPSTIYHIYSGLQATPLVGNALDMSEKILHNGELPKLQVVKKEGNWFALNNAQLDLYRRLEDEGKCSKVRVDVVALSQVPRDIRGMMTVPATTPTASKDQGTAPSASSARPRKTTNTKGYERLDQSEDRESDHVTESEPEESLTESSDFADSLSDSEWSDSELGSSEYVSSTGSEEEQPVDNEKETLL